MAWFASRLILAAEKHDHTKISGIDDFYDSFSRGLTGDAFKAEKWFQSHLEERHHLNDRCRGYHIWYSVLSCIYFMVDVLCTRQKDT